MNLPVPALALGFLAGLLLASLLLVPAWLRVRRRSHSLREEVEHLGQRVPKEDLRAQEEAFRSQLAAAREELEARARALEADLAEARARLAESERLRASERRAWDQADQSLRQEVLGEARFLGAEVDQLLGLVKTFDRWHAEVDALLGHNQEMHVKNQEFFSIVNQVVVLALNASIEASKAGVHGRGFRVVAEGVRDLALRMERLSKDHNENLHKNDLITTTTFQDLQAGGKMITAAVVGLKVVNDRIQGRVAGEGARP